MLYTTERSINIQHLKPNCKKCFGLCCVALYFSVQDGFPTDKNAGIPCPNLKEDFRCAIHGQLGALGLKGCIAYECFGSGQQVSQITFAGQDWHQESSLSNSMFKTFLIMRQLHEMSWYLYEALSLKQAAAISEEIRELLNETECITRFTPNALLEFDVLAHRKKTNVLLEHTSKLVRTESNLTDKTNFNAKKNCKKMSDYFGKDLRKKDMQYQDLRGACLIAANLEGVDLSGSDLIGADLRDANLSGANLSKSIFLTQFQINAAKGNSNTELPSSLFRPKHWT